MSDDAAPKSGSVSSAADAATETDALVRALERADRFSLIFAVCDNNSFRSRVIAEVQERLRPLGEVVEFPLWKPVDHLLRTLEAGLNPEASPAAVFVYGMESWLPAGDKGENNPFVLNLNASRNRFPHVLRCPLVLWVAEHILTSIARGAPDFTSVRSGIYTFQAAPETAARLQTSMLEGDLAAIAGLPFDEKIERLAQLEERLEEYRKLPADRRDPNLERRLVESCATLYYTMGRHDKNEILLRWLLEDAQTRLGLNHPVVATTLGKIAWLLQDTNRLSEAEPLARRALEIDEKALGPNHPKVSSDLNNLGRLLRATNRLSEAEPLMRRSLRIAEEFHGRDHPGVVHALDNLAALLLATNHPSEAEPLMRRALEIDENSYGPNHPYVAICLNNLAQILKATNRLSEAEPLMRRALEIDEKSYGPDHPAVARDLNNLATLLQDTNRLSEAEPLMRRALEIDETSFGPDHPNVATDLNNLAMLLRATNRLSEAEPLSRRHLTIFLDFTRRTGHEHPHLRAAIGNYSDLLAKMGRTPDEIRATLDDLARQSGVELDRLT